jgi:hypothetical protein
MYRRLNIGDHTNVAYCLNILGVLYINLKENQKGLKYNLESLDMYIRLRVGVTPNVAKCLSNIGVVCVFLFNNISLF